LPQLRLRQARPGRSRARVPRVVDAAALCHVLSGRLVCTPILSCLCGFWVSFPFSFLCLSLRASEACEGSGGKEGAVGTRDAENCATLLACLLSCLLACFLACFAAGYIYLNEMRLGAAAVTRYLSATCIQDPEYNW
jgi:hypothetical protein